MIWADSGNLHIKWLIPGFCAGTVPLLHDVPWRAGAAQTGAAVPDAVLSDGFAGRRAGRDIRGADRAACVHALTWSCRSACAPARCWRVIVAVERRHAARIWGVAAARRRWCIAAGALAGYLVRHEHEEDQGLPADGPQFLWRAARARRAPTTNTRSAILTARHHQSRRTGARRRSCATSPPLITGANSGVGRAIRARPGTRRPDSRGRHRPGRGRAFHLRARGRLLPHLRNQSAGAEDRADRVHFLSAFAAPTSRS